VERQWGSFLDRKPGGNWKQVCLTALLFAVCATQAFAWGSKGHEISARAAVNALPKDFPAFFLAAKERLVYLCPEPDRWKGGRTAPALGALNPPDHYFDLEYWGADKIPATRYELLFAAYKRGLVGEKPVSDLGTAPVAIAEFADKLTTNFREWRDTREDTDAARMVRRQVEENIIYLAGVMGHFITDLGNPLHCTVHHNGWAEGYPNPNGYPTVREAHGLHSRFESQYVDQAINEKDLAALVPASRRTGPWVAEMEKFLRRNNGLVEQLYQIDKRGAFGSGHEPPEAQSFALQRLADSAGMLRDVWVTAWLNSGDEWLNESVMCYGRGGKTLLELLRERNHVETKTFPFGQLVTGIGNRTNGLDGRDWMYYVNGKHGAESADKYVPKDNERVEWRFEGGGKQ
jgi:hypothetical protein